MSRISKPFWSKKDKLFIATIYYDDGSRKKSSFARIIMEQHLGRELTKDEVITYVDGDSKNINLENLKIILKNDHLKKLRINNYNNSDKKSKSHPDLILDYFKEINTKDKAYWLGFLFADGCLIDKHYRIRLGLKTTDIESIKKFIHDIGGNLEKIKTRTDKRSLGGRPEKEYSTSYVYVDNKIFYSYLLKCGLFQNKTLLIQVPECIKTNSQENIYAFIQGYFDGDGCIDKKTVIW